MFFLARPPFSDWLVGALEGLLRVNMPVVGFNAFWQKKKQDRSNKQACMSNHTGLSQAVAFFFAQKKSKLIFFEASKQFSVVLHYFFFTILSHF